MTNYEDIVYEVDGPVAIITFNRPERLNAFTREMLSEIDDAYAEAEADADVRAIILTGSGRAFSAGMNQSGDNPYWTSDRGDLSSFLKGWGAGANADPAHLKIWRLTKPVIAAVSGWCVGGGFFLALESDITLAAADAVFALPEVRHGAGIPFQFAALCGWKVAHRYGLTGDHFDAQEALRIGFINEVVPTDNLLDEAKKLANRLAHVPESAVRMNKAVTTMGLMASGVYNGMLMRQALGPMIQASLGPERERLREIRERDGVSAFLAARDEPFMPEKFGPRSRPRDSSNSE